MDWTVRIDQIALDAPVRVARGATLRAVAEAMQSSGVSCVLVGSGPPEVVTDFDLVGALAAGLPADIPASEVATREPVWATTSTTVGDALGMMTRSGIRHLVVLAPSGEVVGVLSLLEATRRLLDAAAPLLHPRH